MRAVILATLLGLSCCSPAASEGGKRSGDPNDPKEAPGNPTPPPPPPGAAPDAGGAADSGTPGPTTNGFPAKWIDGTSCSTDPEIQTWSYTSDTFILRQSLCTTFEGPFMYLFVGATK